MAQILAAVGHALKARAGVRRGSAPCTLPAVAKLSADHVALGAAVRELRSRAGWSQQELADRAQLHRTYIGGIERGERNVSYENLVKVANALDLPGSQLLAHAEHIAAS